MKYYVVFDTNVLVSAALKKDSVPGLTVQLAFSALAASVFIISRLAVRNHQSVPAAETLDRIL